MFKWLVKTWKIWRLNRRWYEVLYDDDRHDICMVKVCFGKQLFHMYPTMPIERLTRKDENEWFTIADSTWTGHHLKYSSSAIERKYQEYLSELAELNLL